MKKLFLGMIALSMLSMASCNTDVSDTTATVGYVGINLVTPLDGTSEPFITEANYRFFFNLTKGVTSVAMDGLKIDNADNSFSTDTVPFTQYYVHTDLGDGILDRITGAKGNFNKDASLPLSGFNCDLTGLFYWNNTIIPGIENPAWMSSDPTMLVMQYKVGNEYLIKTLQQDAFYCGTTKTTVGGTQSFENKEMTYRVKFNKGYKTVDVIIYNAKFSEKAPSLTAVVLKNLDVTFETDTFGPGTYTISGTDIIPYVPDGGALTEYKNYPFKNFRMEFKNDALTESVISYNVELHIQKDGKEIVMPAEGSVLDASYLIKAKNAN